MGAFPSAALPKPEIGASVMEYAIGPGREGFIGLDVLPQFPVGTKEGTYGVLPREAFTVIPDTARLSDGSYNRQQWAFETDTYACEEHGLEELLGDDKVEQYGGLFNYEDVVSKKIMWQLLLAQEKRIADLCHDGTITGASAAAKWDVPASATPKADVDAGRQAIRAATGMLPTKIAMDWETFHYLVKTDEVVDEVKYTSPISQAPEAIQKQMLAVYFGVDEILLSNRIYNSADKGQAFATAAIWDKTKVLLFVPATAMLGIEQPALGVSMLWTADSPDNVVAEEYRDEPRRGNVLRVRQHLDEVLVASSLGYVVDTVL